jgi:hypothetical protein
VRCIRAPAAPLGSLGFLPSYGCDETAALIALGRIVEGDRRADLMRLVVADHQIARRLDMRSLMDDLPSFYWRGRAAMVVLAEHGPSALRALASDHPAEAVFALRRANRSDLVDLVDAAMATAHENPDVVANAIVAYAMFGRRDQLVHAAAIGARLLTSHEQKRVERLRADMERPAAAVIEPRRCLRRLNPMSATLLPCVLAAVWRVLPHTCMSASWRSALLLETRKPRSARRLNDRFRPLQLQERPRAGMARAR